MTAPVYVVNGFLGSGKTRFLSKMLRSDELKKILILQFEEGESQLTTSLLQRQDSRHMSWTKEDLETDYEHIVEEITEEIKTYEYREIWVEWNGMEAFSKLERIFLQLGLRTYVHIEKVFYVALAGQADMLLGQTGDGPLSQVAASDMAVLHGSRGLEDEKNLKEVLKSISPTIEINASLKQGFNPKRLKEKRHYNIGFAAVVVLMLGLLLAVPYFQEKGVPLDTVFTIFTGVFLQGVPFLIIGVLLSSAIWVFLPKGWLEKVFPANPVLGMAAGVLSGFFLPVCDCASIPVFKSLIKKGVPLPAAVCFVAAAPVVNPVVLMSTYYAFNADIRMVFYRTGLGIICAVLIGLTFFLRKSKDFLKDSGRENFTNCMCGCFEETEENPGVSGRMNLFLRHAQTEFYSVGKYLLIGIFISAVFQVSSLQWVENLEGANMPLSVLAMMVLAFLLSLCSSSDAVVARSLSGIFSSTAMLGFMVFGPMVDIKNVFMLKGYFKGKFVWRFCVTTFLVCYAVVLLFGFFSGGVTI